MVFIFFAVLFFIGSLKANTLLINRRFQNHANEAEFGCLWSPNTTMAVFKTSMHCIGKYYLLIQQYQASTALVNRNDGGKLMPVYNVFINDVLNMQLCAQKRFYPYSIQHT